MADKYRIADPCGIRTIKTRARTSRQSGGGQGSRNDGSLIRLTKKKTHAHIFMMDKSKVIRAFEKIARKEGISVDEVRCEIQKAIDDAMQSDDPAVQAYWKKIKYKGEKPTPEEVVLYIAKQVKAY